MNSRIIAFVLILKALGIEIPIKSIDIVYAKLYFAYLHGVDLGGHFYPGDQIPLNDYISDNLKELDSFSSQEVRKSGEELYDSVLEAIKNTNKFLKAPENIGISEDRWVLLLGNIANMFMNQKGVTVKANDFKRLIANKIDHIVIKQFNADK